MKLLDLFCGAGGAAMGYYRAGFTEIIGVDIKPQPRYPFTFIQADALQPPVELSRFDLIHASPPCQFASEATPETYRRNHPNLIPATRRLLRGSGRPFVIENVEMASEHLRHPFMLCGSMFGLKIWRHRYFEMREPLAALTPPCRHDFKPILISGMGSTNGGKPRYKSPIAEKRAAIEIDWMTTAEIQQAIPPAYTQWIGEWIINSDALRVA